MPDANVTPTQQDREAARRIMALVPQQRPKSLTIGALTPSGIEIEKFEDAIAEAIARARMAERERCAEIAGEYREGDPDGIPDRIEAAIRALADGSGEVTT